jgi:hypothetical protein
VNRTIQLVTGDMTTIDCSLPDPRTRSPAGGRAGRGHVNRLTSRRFPRRETANAPRDDSVESGDVFGAVDVDIHGACLRGRERLAR